MFAIRLLFKPFAIVAGLLAGRAARGLFASVWRRIDDGEPPTAETRDAPLGKVVAAAALEGGAAFATRAVADRVAASAFEHLTGVWPAKKAVEDDAG